MMPRAKKTLIHVNQNVLKANHKDGGHRPVFTVKSGRKNDYAYRVIIDGPSELIYSPGKPLKCGAKAWIVTNAPVRLEVDPVAVNWPQKDLAPVVRAPKVRASRRSSKNGLMPGVNGRK